MQIDDDFDMGSMGERWQHCWAMVSKLHSKLRTEDSLDIALAHFLNEEIEIDEGRHKIPLVMGVALSAITNEGTHSQEYLKAAFTRLSAKAKNKESSFICLPSTPARRMQAVFSPFTAAMGLFVYNKNYEMTFGSMFFAMVTVALLIFSFTKISDWIFGE